MTDQETQGRRGRDRTPVQSAALPAGSIITPHESKVRGYLAQFARYDTGEIDMAIARALVSEITVPLRDHYVYFDGALYAAGPADPGVALTRSARLPARQAAGASGALANRDQYQSPAGVHSGDMACAVRPLHDPCHTGCSEDGRTAGDMTVPEILSRWRDQIREAAALTGDESAVSRTVLDAIAAEAVRAHAKHGEDSMAGSRVDDGMRLAIAVEESGEVSEVALDLALELLAANAGLQAQFGRVAHVQTATDGLNAVGLAEDLYAELIQAGAMAATWATRVGGLLAGARARGLARGPREPE